MAQNYKGHWKIYGPPDLNGKIHGLKFKDGFAYLNWKDKGEETTEKIIQALGSDERFRVVEIPEKDSQWGSK